MSIKRFVAPTGREALAQVRRELGEDALVLSTRKLTGGRMEVLAVGAEDMQSLVEDSRSSREAPARLAQEGAAAKNAGEATARVHAPTSGARIESFEDFLLRQGATQNPREAARAVVAPAARLDRLVEQGEENIGHTAAALRQEDTGEPAQPPSVFRRRAPAAAAPMQAPMAEAPTPVAAAVSVAAAPVVAAPVVAAPVAAAPVAAAPVAAAPVVAPVSTVAAAALAQPVAHSEPVAAGSDARLLAELQTMRALLIEQMATMGAATTAAEMQRRSPMQVRAMTRLLTAGFSPEVARQIAERAPAAATPAESDRWLADVLALNVRSVDADSDWLARGGIFALVGPTGVGKTTTVAKLAARFAVRHGTQALGLITLDAFRVGAHEQLRTYGRILGTPVHLAQDMVTLRDLLASMTGKRLVLIDTCGVSQRDERLQEMLEMLDQASTAERPIERLLLLNAASHAETLDDVARSWRSRQCAGALLTKLDEAARIGGALDCLLRHKLTVLGATNGQRVPEDWLAVDSRQLASAALRPGQGSFALAETEAALLGATVQAARVAVIQ